MIALLLFFQAMPAWVQAAHSQPVELHAQLMPVIKRQPQHIRAGEMRAVRERALSARHWLPRFPATQVIPAGYSAYIATLRRPVSGLEIVVESLRSDAFLLLPDRRRILDEIHIQPPAQPTCQEPMVEWLKPLFDILAEDAGSLYLGREAKLAALERWGAWAESPFDVLGFVEFARALKLSEPEDRVRAAGLVASVLSRAPAPPCGMSFLLMPVNIRGAVLQTIEAFGQAPMILVAYRQFVARTLAAPICRASPEEGELRRTLAADFNAKLERWPAEKLGGDLHHEDSRIERLLSLELPAALRSAHAAASLTALSRSRLKTEEPGLWTALSLEFLVRLKASFPLPEPPADPALDLLWGLACGRY